MDLTWLECGSFVLYCQFRKFCVLEITYTDQMTRLLVLKFACQQCVVKVLAIGESNKFSLVPRSSPNCLKSSKYSRLDLGYSDNGSFSFSYTIMTSSRDFTSPLLLLTFVTPFCPVFESPLNQNQYFTCEHCNSEYVYVGFFG